MPGIVGAVTKFFQISFQSLILGYGALTTAMRTGEVSAVTPLRYARLLFAMGLGVLVFGERPDAATLAGSAIIVACGLFILTQRQRIGSGAA